MAVIKRETKISRKFFLIKVSFRKNKKKKKRLGKDIFERTRHTQTKKVRE